MNTLLDSDTMDITLLDWEHVIACEGILENDEPCPEPAKYVIRMLCCNAAIFYCEGCLMFLVEWLNRNSGILRMYSCVHCDNKFGSDDRRIFRVAGRIND